MADTAVRFDGVSKKFRRTLSAGVLYGLEDLARALLRQPARESLRRDEFWAVRDISFAARRGECIGILGPNGAGKSTLLKLADREYRPDRGRVVTTGQVKSLIRLGSGLQPLLTGRENIYAKCAELGIGQREARRRLDDIVSFGGLEKVLDTPVKRYSDGLYARLEFAIVTAVPLDILLLDEVLAVCDLAFQVRCLERLQQLKRAGTTILFVSHSEPNIRHVADRCLLLFEGQALAYGEPPALFRKYYQALGFRDPGWEAWAAPATAPAEAAAWLTDLEVAGTPPGELPRGHTGQPLELIARYATTTGELPPVSLALEFWNAAGLQVASLDSGSTPLRLAPVGRLRVRIPFLGLTAGVYRVAGGFRQGGQWLGYRDPLLRLGVVQDRCASQAPLVLPAEVVQAD